MKNYFTIFRLLFKYMFRKSGEKGSKWIWAAYIFVGLVFAAVIVSICLAIAALAETVNGMGLLPEFITLLLTVACIAVVLLGLVPMMTYLYFSRDTEFMLTLPVKPSTVFMAKLSVVYLTEIIVSTVILIPAMLSVGIITGQSALFYIVMLFAILLVPAIPLVIVAVLAIPLMWIVSFFKNKGALTSIVVILLGCGVFAAYYALIAGMNSGAGDEFDPEAIVAALTNVLNTVAAILVPLAAIARLATLSPKTAFGEFSVGVAALINLAVFVGFVVVLLALAVLVSSAVYRRGARSILEGGTKKNGGKVEFTESDSALSAFFKKEWRELVRTPAFAFQCLSGILLCPIIIYFMSTMYSTGFDAGAEEELTAETVRLFTIIKSFVLIGFIAMFGISMNVGAPTAITREGKNFYLLKVIPVPYRVQIRAKVRLYALISSLSIFTSLVVSAVLAFDVANIIFGTIFLLLYNYGYNCVCVYIDLRRPKLNWSTPNEAVKNNRNAVVPMLINMAIGILLIFIPIMFVITIPSEIVAKVISWVILCGIGATAAVVCHNLLYANVDKLFDKIVP